MSESTSPIASAMAFMDAADAPASAPEQQPNSAPQAEPIAENQAEDPAPSASAETDASATPEDAHETKSRAEQRIKQLNAREREAREEAEYWRGIAQQRGLEPVAPPQPAGPPPLHDDLAKWLGPEPDPNDPVYSAGEFDPKFLRAIARHEARHEQAQQAMAQRAQAFRQQQEARAKTFFEQADKAAAEKPDFRDVVGMFGRSVPDAVAEMVADAGAEVAYAIAKDAEVAARVRSAKSPTAVAREIGRVEARLEALAEAKASASAEPKPTPQPSNAPPPPPKAVRGSSPAVGFDWSNASPAQIQARINAR